MGNTGSVFVQYNYDDPYHKIKLNAREGQLAHHLSIIKTQMNILTYQTDPLDPLDPPNEKYTRLFDSLQSLDKELSDPESNSSNDSQSITHTKEYYVVALFELFSRTCQEIGPLTTTEPPISSTPSSSTSSPIHWRHHYPLESPNRENKYLLDMIAYSQHSPYHHKSCHLPAVILQISTDIYDHIPINADNHRQSMQPYVYDQQIWTYINHLETYFPFDSWIILGITWNLFTKTIKLNAYYKHFEEQKGNIRGSQFKHGSIGIVKLWKCINYTPEDIRSLCLTINQFLLYGNDDHLNFNTQHSQHISMLTNGLSGRHLSQHVYYDSTTQVIYKIYDNQLQQYGWSCHGLQQTCKYLSGKVLFVNDEETLMIIQYPYIVGDHHPKNIHQILDILQQLILLHEKQEVHGDIRLTNMIFPEVISDNPSKNRLNSTNNTLNNNNNNHSPTGYQPAVLIDYDFSGRIHQVQYPSNYITNISDGRRHPEAVEFAFILPIHDCYSFAMILNKFQPQTTDTKLIESWLVLITMIQQGELIKAKEALLHIDSQLLFLPLVIRHNPIAYM